MVTQYFGLYEYCLQSYIYSSRLGKTGHHYETNIRKNKHINKTGYDEQYCSYCLIRNAYISCLKALLVTASQSCERTASFYNPFTIISDLKSGCCGLKRKNLGRCSYANRTYFIWKRSG